MLCAAGLHENYSFGTSTASYSYALSALAGCSGLNGHRQAGNGFAVAQTRLQGILALEISRTPGRPRIATETRELIREVIMTHPLWESVNG